MFSAELIDKTTTLLAQCQKRGWHIATAESCTGGLVAALLTEIPGASAVIERCYVTYSNKAKHQELGVPNTVLETQGAVSQASVCAMAEGARARSGAELAIAISGIAGPSGGTEDKAVGLVHFATATQDGVKHKQEEFGHIGRRDIRLASLVTAIDMLAARL